jgi:hypothetical protein
MALRDQPYLPLYIQDVLTDEKLVECSAESHGVYFLLLCILHKQEKYGLLCLKQKYKQNSNKVKSFALMLCRQMPFQAETIESALIELIDENVLSLGNDCLFQKRMVNDGELSILRTEVGKKGGSVVTKQYGKKGFLYLMSDGFDRHKIGISVNPKNRLYRLRCDLNLPKHFEIVEVIAVEDMGISEDFSQTFFGDKMDGEWIIDSNENVLKNFALLKAKLLAKPQANSEIEIDNEIKNENVLNKNEKLFSELTEMELNNSIEYLDRVAQKKFSQDDLKNIWEGFKIQYSKDFYVNRGKVINHFRDWLKKQNHADSKKGTSVARLDALRDWGT